MGAEVKGSFCPAPFVRDTLSERGLHLAVCFGRDRIPELGYIFPQHSMRLINLVSTHVCRSRRMLVFEKILSFMYKHIEHLTY